MNSRCAAWEACGAHHSTRLRAVGKRERAPLSEEEEAHYATLSCRPYFRKNRERTHRRLRKSKRTDLEKRNTKRFTLQTYFGSDEKEVEAGERVVQTAQKQLTGKPQGYSKHPFSREKNRVRPHKNVHKLSWSMELTDDQHPFCPAK